MKKLEATIKDHWVATIVAGFIAGNAILNLAAFVINDLSNRLFYDKGAYSGEGDSAWKSYLSQIIVAAALLWVAEMVYSRRSGK